MTELNWHKSSYSGSQANCVEVARRLGGIVAVRDSKDPDGPKLALSPAGWQRFTADIKASQHALS